MDCLQRDAVILCAGSVTVSLPTGGKQRRSLLLQQTENSSAPPKSLSSQEALISMPTRSNDDGLRTSLDRLEGKVDNQSREIQTIGLNIAGLQTTVGKHTEELDGLDHTINDIRTLIEERTSEGRTVTWKQLLMFAGLFAAVVFPIV